jgi:methionine-rich copper-binding protein CopC
MIASNAKEGAVHRRLGQTIIWIIILALVSGGATSALAQGTPTDEHVFTEPPQAVQQQIDPSIDPQTVQLIVIAPNGARADDGVTRTTAEGVRSTILRPGLGDGDYLVYWISGEPGKRADAFGEDSFAVSGSTPCQPSGSATPPAEECLPDPPTGAPGTPIATNGISVTLDVSNDQAGPVDLSATVIDAAGAPVEGATVIFRARHLEMNHGELPYLAAETSPGIYDAGGVGLGMGGHWRIAVDVTLPDQPPVTVFVEQMMVE